MASDPLEPSAQATGPLRPRPGPVGRHRLRGILLARASVPLSFCFRKASLCASRACLLASRSSARWLTFRGVVGRTWHLSPASPPPSGAPPRQSPVTSPVPPSLPPPFPGVGWVVTPPGSVPGAVPFFSFPWAGVPAPPDGDVAEPEGALERVGPVAAWATSPPGPAGARSTTPDEDPPLSPPPARHRMTPSPPR
jgi:hypothetical protein